LAVALFAATFFTTTTMGASWVLAARTDVISPLGPFLSPTTIAMVWTNAGLLATGLSFSLPVMFILLCHELGHYLCCRRYGIDATPPFFVPAPLVMGTFGAFIRIRSPIPDRRQLFDVGVAGPIAGFVALLPILVYGIAHSHPANVELARVGERYATLQIPGSSLLTILLTRLFHGELPAGAVLNPHPFVLAGWMGLLATSLNLLPLAQLDGGHILYAAVGRLQWKLALPMWLALLVVCYFFPVWLLWAFIVLAIGIRHPPVANESIQLDAGRTALAVLALAMLALSFMPVPVDALFVRP
jgi:membrane-associated protease RseP (regulator of RpoE activity)